MSVRYVTTNVRFDPTDYADLQRLAAASGYSLAACVRMAVTAYLGRSDGQTAEAREAQAAFTPTAIEPEPEVPAIVRGSTLVLERPLPGFKEGSHVWIRCVGAAERAQRRRHQRVVATLLAEFAAMAPGSPVGPISDEDREIYKP